MGIAAAAGIAGAVGGVASAAGSLFGGSKGSAGSGQSAYLQALEMNQNIVNTQPFISAGGAAAGQLQNMLASGQLGTPMDMSGQPTAAQVPQYTGGPPPQFSWNPTMAGLAQTPGYQFTLQQGLLGTQNAAAAQGLGVSGAALKGAAGYATGLANSTYNQQLNNAESIYGNQLAGYNAGLAGYGQQLAGFQTQQGAFQNQFNDYWANQTNRYNQLANLSQLGGNVAVGQGSNATTAASNIGNAVQTGAQVQAAGTQGALNSLGNALSSPQTANLLNSGYNALFGGGSTISGDTVLANQNYENQQFAQQPAGTYGPFA
jgi:hypothetical protein